MTAQHLVYLFPRFYNCSVPSTFATKLPQLAQLCAGHRPEAPSDKKMDQLVSLQGEMFFTFAKSERFVDGKLILLVSFMYILFLLHTKNRELQLFILGFLLLLFV